MNPTVVEVVDNKLTVYGKGTYHSRSWLRSQGAVFDQTTRRWVFPGDCTVTADEVEAKVTNTMNQHKSEVQKKRLYNLAEGRKLQAQRRKELRDPVKRQERQRNYDAFLQAGGVDWKTSGPDSRCSSCKGLMWERPVSKEYLMNCPLCGFGES